MACQQLHSHLLKWKERLFVRERIFEPFGMKETGFSVPADKLDSLASYYSANPTIETLELLDGVQEQC